MRHIKHFLTNAEQPTDFEYDYVSFVDENENSYVRENEHDYSKDYFTVVALTDGSFVFTANEELDEGISNAVSYSINDGEWQEPTNNLNLNVNTNDSIRLKGQMQTDYTDNVSVMKQLGIGKFIGGTALFEINGNIMSLFLEDDFNNSEKLIPILNSSMYTYYEIFKGSNLVSAENLILPSKTCFCMYMSMFQEATLLKKAPQLPATTIEDMCYLSMFNGCTSLERTPILHADKLESMCYVDMFKNCTNLKHITMLATKGVTSGLGGWVKNVYPNGVFVKSKNATWEIQGDNGVPINWIVQKK